MFTPTRAMCPCCTTMQEIRHEQKPWGAILIFLVSHQRGEKECLGTDRRVVMPHEVKYERAA